MDRHNQIRSQKPQQVTEIRIGQVPPREFVTDSIPQRAICILLCWAQLRNKNMRADLAEAINNAIGVCARNDPTNPASFFAVDRIRSFLTAVVRPGMRSLDLGCGAGRFTFALEELGAHATGVDCAEIPLEHARKIAELENRNCTFKQCVLPSLPFKDKSFDFVLLPNNIVEYSYQDMAEMSNQVSRVLDAQGLFCLSFKPKPEDTPNELKVSHYTIPNKGTFEYHSYPWSIQRTKAVIGKHLSFISAAEILDKRWWLTFKKSL